MDNKKLRGNPNFAWGLILVGAVGTYAAIDYFVQKDKRPEGMSRYIIVVPALIFFFGAVFLGNILVKRRWSDSCGQRWRITTMSSCKS